MGRLLIELLKIILITALLLVLTFGVWIFYGGLQPMEIEDARGITFWQFIRERWVRYQLVDARIEAQPQYRGCRNDIWYFLPINLKGAFNYAYASFRPESNLAEAFRYWEDEKPDPVLPTLETVNIAGVPEVFWKYFERAYWRGLVTIDNLAGECALGPVDFSYIANDK
jgi:hypothetical protein